MRKIWQKSRSEEREFIENTVLLGAGSDRGVKADSIANVEMEELLGFG